MSTQWLNLRRDKGASLGKLAAACTPKISAWQIFTTAYSHQGREFRQIHRIDIDIEIALKNGEEHLPWKWQAKRNNSQDSSYGTDDEDFFNFYQDRKRREWQDDLLVRCLGALEGERPKADYHDRSDRPKVV